MRQSFFRASHGLLFCGQTEKLVTAISNGEREVRYFVDDENPQALVRVMRAAAAVR